MEKADIQGQSSRPLLRAFNVAASGFLLGCLFLVLSYPGNLQALVEIRSAGDTIKFLERAMMGLAELRASIIAIAVVALNTGVLLAVRYRRESSPDQVPVIAEQTPRLSGEAVMSVIAPPPTDTEKLNTLAELDITLAENQRLREELSARDVSIAEAESARSRFLARVSHDLRTPMNGVLGMADMLLDSELDTKQKTCVEGIQSSAQSLIIEIDALIDSALLESAQLCLERSRFDLREAIEDICVACAEFAHARKLELMCHIDEEVPHIVDGDGKRLRQIVHTLIDNAIRHTKEGEIVVRVQRVGEGDERGMYRIDVQDSGKGLTPERQLALWKAFASDDPRSSGLLGPSMCVVSALVKLMNGRMLIKSRLDEGTRFSAEVEFGHVAAAHESAPAARSLEGVQVLIVDDNQTNLTVLEHKLMRWGMLVSSARSGAAALDLLAVDSTPEFDLCIFDLNMPLMDGFELARRVNPPSSRDQLPILMLTSSEVDSTQQDLDEIGVLRNLSKPPRQSDLRETLVAMVEHGRRSVFAPVIPLHSEPVAPVAHESEANVAQQGLDEDAIQSIRRLQSPGKPDVVARAASAWLMSATETVSQVKQAQEEEDRVALSAAIKSLSSSSSFIGATGVAEACEQAQYELESFNEPSIQLRESEALTQSVLAIEKACELVRVDLEKLAASAA